MAFALLRRKTTTRNFSRDIAMSPSTSSVDGLLGLGTLFSIAFLGAYLRRREIAGARVQYADPRDDDTTKLLLNPSMESLMRRRRAA